MDIVKFKPDAAMRRRLMVQESFAHPAKMVCGLVLEIAARYGLKPGDWVLDPLAGSGTTMLLALQGINCIMVELEDHFCRPMKASWEKMRRQPMLGHELGQVLILRGDARCLPLNGADCVVSSPAYENSVNTRGRPHPWDGGPNSQAKARGYTRPASPEHSRRVDAVVSSPPYEHTQHSTGQDPEIVAAKLGQKAGTASQPLLKNEYGVGAENIGNLRGPAYWDSMKLVYQECHRVLRLQGVMVLVLKGFTRSGEYVNLPEQTKELVESLGFKLFDRWARELWSLSFWRILQKRRNPEAFDDRLRYEEVLAFRKMDGEGSVDSIVTSPPYEEGIGHGTEGGESIMAEKGISTTGRKGYTRPKEG